MFGQMIAAHEAFIANWTSETFLTGVSAQMPLQFIGTSESFAAEEPIANEWSLTGVPSEMGFQMARLAVDLTTARDMAIVCILLAQMNSGRSKTFGLLTIRAIACGASRVSSLGSR